MVRNSRIAGLGEGGTAGLRDWERGSGVREDCVVIIKKKIVGKTNDGGNAEAGFGGIGWL